MKRERINWNWWGMWLIDYCCAQDAYDSYDIWEDAYLEANPHLMDARESLTADDACDAPGTTLDLIENHYHQSMQPFWDSWLYLVLQILHWPTNTIQEIIWTIKRKLS
ncbi:hypothetical protein Q5692_37835 [Microcoleus sp. C2C3]|uniref:hypothetical protein n=1 Tax=unclassified Microcoleus TaxID=2642155 RepID=UPI002FD6E43F